MFEFIIILIIVVTVLAVAIYKNNQESIDTDISKVDTSAKTVISDVKDIAASADTEIKKI